MNDFVKVGVIGCGYWGPNYVRVLNELAKSKVTWCCDTDNSKLGKIRRLYPFLKTSNDYMKLLENPEIVAVVVSTPASTHYRIVKEALEAGKNVLVEKPMTIHVKQAEEICRIADEMDRVLMVGHIYLYHPVVRKIRSLILDDELGTIYYMHFVRTGLGPIRSDVNALWDLAPHDVSMALYLLDAKPSKVIATGASFLQQGVEDVVTVNLFFGETLVNIRVSWLDAIKTRKLNIIGSKKMLMFDDTESLERLRIFDEGAIYEDKGSPTYGEFRLLLREGDIYVPKVEAIEPLKVMCQHFLDCIKTGGKPSTSGEIGLQVVKILEAAQSSLKNGNIPVKI